MDQIWLHDLKHQKIECQFSEISKGRDRETQKGYEFNTQERLKKAEVVLENKSRSSFLNVSSLSMKQHLKTNVQGMSAHIY